MNLSSKTKDFSIEKPSEDILDMFLTIKARPPRTLIYFTETTRFACAVCKRVGVVANTLSPESGVIYDDTFYFIPKKHTSCRELFNLNPLAYE